MANLKKVLKEISIPNFKTPSNIPIWLLNDKLEKTELEKQIASMAEQGITTFAVKAERGVIPSYLSADFIHYFGYILEQAKKRNMNVVFSDDVQHSHPGAMSGLLEKNPEFRMKYLSLMEILKTKGPRKFTQDLIADDIAYVFAIRLKDKLLDFASAKNLMPMLKGSVLNRNIPAGDWRIFVFRTCNNRKPVGSYVLNSLDSAAAKAYVDKAYLNFRNALPKESVSALKGILVDLPSIAPDTSIRGIPWSEDVLKNLKSVCNTDAMSVILALFVDNFSKKNSEIRRNYYKLLLRLFAANFIKPLQEFCSRQRLESYLYLNAGDLFSGDTLLRFDYSPILQKNVGIEGISGNAPLTTENPASLRLFSDLTGYFSKGRAFSILGRNKNGVGYGLKDLKHESDLLTHAGLGSRFIDGHYYSLRYQGGMRAPANPFVYSKIFKQYNMLLKYLERKTQVLEGGVSTERVGVLFPGESLYASYNPSNLSSYKTKCQHIDAVVRQLQSEGIPFQFVTEELAANLALSAKGELLLNANGKVKGAFRVIIIPEAAIIPKKFIALLEKFVARGGKVIFFGITPFESFEGVKDPNMLKPLEALQAKFPGTLYKFTKVEELDALRTACLAGIEKPVEFFSESQIEKRIACRTFREPGYRYFFLTNMSAQDNVRAELKVNDKGYLYYLDLSRGALYSLPASDSHGVVKPFIYNFAPHESTCLVLADQKHPASTNTCLPLEDNTRLYRIILKDQWEYDVPEDNTLPLTGWSMKINSNRDINSGFNIAYESYVNVEQVPAKSLLFLNNLINRHINGYESGFYPVEIAFNGVVLKNMQFFGRGERAFHETEALKKANYGGIEAYAADVTAHVRKGFNRVTIKTFGSTFSPMLIKYPILFMGQFEVRRGNKGWMILQKGEAIKYGSWCEQGYPFYCGRIVYRQIFEKPDNYKRVMLRLKNFESVAQVRVNGNPVTLLPWQPACADISKLIQNDKNKIEIEVGNLHNNLVKMNEMASGLTGEVYVDVYQ